MGDISTASALDKKVHIISQLLSKLNDFAIGNQNLNGLKEDIQQFDQVMNDKELGLQADNRDIRVRRQSLSE